MTKSLDNKVAIITGSSSGIGKATAILFSKLGAKVVLSGRDEKKLDETISLCENKENVLSILGDITDEGVCQRLVDEALKKFGRLDILVNNAGMATLGSIENIKMEEYERIMKVNVTAPLNLTRLSVPHLIKTKGSIINISSVCGTRSFTGCLAYCMSKAALDQFTKCTALELADKGVRVNSVNPGVIITDFQKAMGLNEDYYQQFIENSKKTHPLGRVGTSEEVANSIAFLASDDASFITGELLHVDGGFHAAAPKLVN